MLAPSADDQVVSWLGPLSSSAQVEAPLHFLAPEAGSPVQVRVYQPGSGLDNVRPADVAVLVPIHDARPSAQRFTLDEQGFELHLASSAFSDFYASPRVVQHYYPEVRELVRALTGALEVIVFDHNARSALRAARHEPGVQEPVAQVHNDYTLNSGPRRKLQILEAAGRLDLARHHVAFVNLWRPIIGPVRDNPLALCAAQSVQPEQLVPTEIQHYGNDDLVVPRQRGEIYSVRYAASQRWFYFSEMQPAELILLKGYDSRADGRARFVPHTGFQHPGWTRDFVPRESIEARTLVVFDELA
jgi:hypothetical protein